MSLEDSNYYNDRRVRVALEGKPSWMVGLDESRMKVSVEIFNEEEEAEVVELPIRFEVCGTCDGKGTHVNPSIDAGGLSQEDFAEDPDFAEDYFSGRYDEICYECNGRRVSPAIDLPRYDRLTAEQKRAVDYIDAWERDEAEVDAIYRSERMFGC